MHVPPARTVHPALMFQGPLLGLRPTLCALGLCAALAGCGQNSAPTAGRGGAMALAEVGVVAVKRGNVDLLTELPGRLEASRVAQVRARAAGIVQKRLFREGSDVKAGQVLFEIDAAPYQAALSSAQAGLSRAQANLMQAAAQAERFKPLAAAKAISEQEFVSAQAAHQQALADVAAATAAVQ
ncbi:MAG: efflux RND transporter periplasmic adaptor subunit, partial [Betaproteobacteria bacterium]